MISKSLMLSGLLLSSTGLLAESAPTGNYFQIRHHSFFDNNESSGAWEETQPTITYFGSVLEPTYHIQSDAPFEAKLGVGLYVQFDQETKLSGYYPILQTKLKQDSFDLIMGTLENDHDFPEPMLNPIIKMAPQIRKIGLQGDTFSHGRYEYGFQFLRKKEDFSYDLYLNWQLPDTVQHRERFDVGLTVGWEKGLPWYGGFHYWHNGGHEHPHVVSITENYNGAIGVRTQGYSVLYMVSLDIPDRSQKDLTTTGHGGFVEKKFFFPDYVNLGLQAWVTDGQKPFLATEGDPYFKMPVYLGVNFFRTWQWTESGALDLYVKNGFFTTPDHTNLQVRFDQHLALDFHHRF